MKNSVLGTYAKDTPCWQDNHPCAGCSSQFYT